MRHQRMTEPAAVCSGLSWKTATWYGTGVVAGFLPFPGLGVPLNFLSPDSGFMKGLADLVDAIWINILMMVTSIPLISIGAALTAGHDAARRSLEGQGHVTSNYFRAFRANFIKATMIWLVFAPLLLLLLYAWVVLQIAPLLIIKFAFSILWVLGFEWVWALQSRFENTIGRTLFNAWVFALANLGRTLIMVFCDALYFALLILSWFYMPQGLFLLLLCGYGTLIMVHTPLLNGAFKHFLANASMPRPTAVAADQKKTTH